MAILAFIIILILNVYVTISKAPETVIDLNAWWGPKHLRHKNETSIRPFKIVFDDKMIEDLRYRLRNQRRVAPPLKGVGFEYGFNSKQLYPWIKYWADKYPFKEREEFLNQYPQYKTNIQGLDIHFIRVKPKVHHGKQVVPLLLLHGWPGSVREFYETIPHLTSVCKHRDFAVEIIAPSLPGFAYSDSAVRPGLGGIEMAVIMRNLMHRLGHYRFYVQGGDWGAFIGQNIATLFPKEVLGYHTNLAAAFTSEAFSLTVAGAVFPPSVVDSRLADRMYPLLQQLLWLVSETGYFHLQATKPDTLGVGMTDSPGGLMAYILQMFSTGTRRRNVYKEDGGLHDTFPPSNLIDNLMMYWVPNSITTSFRIYAETSNLRNWAMGVYETPTPVPTCTIHAKDEILYQSPTILRTKFPNLLNSTALFDGGHFLALEMPELFADNVLKSITAFRDWHETNKLHYKKIH